MLLANDDNSSSEEGQDRIAAQPNLEDIPFLQGAIEASKDGIKSSLYRENSRSRRAVVNHEEVAKTCPFTYPLLFDPQTAGGLLFFVSPDICDEFMQELSQNPDTKGATIIGQVMEYKNDDSKASLCEMDSISACKQTANRISIKF
jgi:selenide,water dikinase